MGLDVYSYLIVGLSLSRDDVYEKTIACDRCHKVSASRFCPHCGGQIKEGLALKPQFQTLIDNDDESFMSDSCEDGNWFLAIKKFETDSNRSGNAIKKIALEELAVSDAERTAFEQKAQKLGVWNKEKFGVYLFQYHSY